MAYPRIYVAAVGCHRRKCGCMVGHEDMAPQDASRKVSLWCAGNFTDTTCCCVLLLMELKYYSRNRVEIPGSGCVVCFCPLWCYSTFRCSSNIFTPRQIRTIPPTGSMRNLNFRPAYAPIRLPASERTKDVMPMATTG